MRITILNGEMKDEVSRLTLFINSIVSKLESQCTIQVFDLQKMDLHSCIGCWTCWTKTPGLCIHKDEGEKIFKAVINSDWVIFASPLLAGFTSSLLKKITDRLIVLLHPYIEIRNKECHHKKRYDQYPDFGLIIEHEGDTDEEDIAILKDIYDRFALNFHSNIKFVKEINNNLNEIVDEIING